MNLIQRALFDGFIAEVMPIVVRYLFAALDARGLEYWHGPWAMDYEIHSRFCSAQSIECRNRANMRDGRPWGCAEAEPGEF